MDKYFMNIAIKQAKKAMKKGDFPVGAVIVKNNKILSKAYNKKNIRNITIYHAEILSIIKACKKLKSWRLNDCVMYVTLEPCQMCYGAIVESRISKVIYLTDSNYKETFSNVSSKLIKIKLENNCEYLKMLNNFFDRK